MGLESIMTKRKTRISPMKDNDINEVSTSNQEITKPIIATAVKIDDEGKEISDEDLVKIKIPLKEDINTINKTIKNMKNRKKGDKMSEIDIEKTVEEVLERQKLNETFQKTNEEVRKISERLSKNETNIQEILNKVNKLNNNLDNLSSNEEKLCTGIDCLKEDITKHSKLNDEIKQEIAQLKENVSKNVAICSGENGCNAEIPVGSSYCPNCGKQILGWSNMPDWKPYPERSK